MTSAASWSRSVTPMPSRSAGAGRPRRADHVCWPDAVHGGRMRAVRAPHCRGSSRPGGLDARAGPAPGQAGAGYGQSTGCHPTTAAARHPGDPDTSPPVPFPLPHPSSSPVSTSRWHELGSGRVPFWPRLALLATVRISGCVCTQRATPPEFMPPFMPKTLTGNPPMTAIWSQHDFESPAVPPRPHELPDAQHVQAP